MTSRVRIADLSQVCVNTRHDMVVFALTYHSGAENTYDGIMNSAVNTRRDIGQTGA